MRQLAFLFVALIIFLPSAMGQGRIVLADTALTPTSITQTDTTYHPGRLRLMTIGSGALYATALVGLNELWYKDYDRSNFHFFDDSREWLQMDKAGHIMTAYYESQLGYEAFRWSGLSGKKSTWIGGSIGFLLQTPIEVLDGFSTNWGFSLTDLAANTTGSALFISQQLLWQEQKLKLKYSFTPTEFAQYRPNTLGDGFLEEVLKDYNGQTYWLSVPIKEVTPGKWLIPGWLCISIGYGAEGMIGAEGNPKKLNGEPIPHFERYRQYYLSLDADLSRIETGSKTVNTILDLISFIKIPAPALEYNKEVGWKGHWIKF